MSEQKVLVECGETNVLWSLYRFDKYNLYTDIMSRIPFDLWEITRWNHDLITNKTLTKFMKKKYFHYTTEHSCDKRTREQGQIGCRSRSEEPL